jgi:hypothetical protein
MVIAAFFLLAVALAIQPVAADGSIDALLQAEAIVTGTGQMERERGFRLGLREILSKLAGDPTLGNSAKLEPFLDNAASYIEAFTYEDRMKDLPIRDEQGTRDRPHVLRMTANSAKVADALRSLDLEVWQGRPDIDVILTVKDFRRNFLVGAESADTAGNHATYLGFPLATAHSDGYEQREVLKAIARRNGLTLRLPGSNAFGSAGSARYRADLSVLPSGYWKLDARAWAGDVRGTYADAAACFSFEISGVSFDEALRKSFESFEAWLRRDKNASLCGLPAKAYKPG